MHVVRKITALGLMYASVLACSGAHAQTSTADHPQPAAHSRAASIAQFQQHLASLSEIVDNCARARNLKACDPALVGPDDRVPVVNGSRSEQRLIRYGWLRILLSKAEDPDVPANTPIKSTAQPKVGAVQENPPLSQLLKDAKDRLQSDLVESRQPWPAVLAHAAERNVMEQVLAGPEFRNLNTRTVRDSIFERIQNWLNRLFESIGNLKTRSAWIGRILVWGFITVVCVALAWSLIRLEHRWRVRLTPDNDLPAPGAPSAREWQLWMEDARRAAAAGQWREAIHLVYWAAISRLESRRLWPADRARTPREYLALIAPEDRRRSGLAQLTSAFERFWYGGRVAAEVDYKHAESVATMLISGGTHSDLPASEEGGAR